MQQTERKKKEKHTPLSTCQIVRYCILGTITYHTNQMTRLKVEVSFKILIGFLPILVNMWGYLQHG